MKHESDDEATHTHTVWLSVAISFMFYLATHRLRTEAQSEFASVQVVRSLAGNEKEPKIFFFFLMKNERTLFLDKCTYVFLCLFIVHAFLHEGNKFLAFFFFFFFSCARTQLYFFFLREFHFDQHFC